MNPSIDPNAWATHLRTIAERALAQDPPPAQGAVVGVFFAWRARRTQGVATPPTTEDDVALWRALTDERVDVDAILGGRVAGSLFEQGAFRAIEVWTESELSGLHALWWLARERARPEWAARIATARDWYLEHIQPDNATNRPWALPVFLELGTPEARHYAETLLHNAMSIGAMDALSAEILLDGADALRAMAND